MALHNSGSEKIIDADVRDAKDDSGTVKTAIMVPLKRHPLMDGVSKEYVKELQEEADLDRALGLSNQLRMDELDMVRHDIDELTSSREFVEVTELDLQKVFEWNKLEIKCSIQNILTFMNVFKVPIISAILSVCSFFIASHHKPTIEAFIIIGGVLTTCCVASIVILAMSKTKIITLVPRWNRDDIKITGVRLPKAAKLKIKEALDSQIFIRFDLVHPSINERESRIGLPEYNADPGVVGVTADNRQFLIVCWDVANDKVKTNPNRLKALKLKQKMSSRRTFNGLGGREY